MLEISGVGVFAAFLAGAISFLSPCVLPLVPGYVSYIAGQDLGEARRNSMSARLPAIALSACFVLGFSTVFILLGAGASMLGHLLLVYHYELSIVGGAFVIAFGLFMLGIFRSSLFYRDLRLSLDVSGGRPLGAYLLGLAFAFGWTPCIGPILGAILTVSASSSKMTDGILLLSIYSAGLGVPFLLAAIFIDTITKRLKKFGSAGRVLYKVAGGVMVIMGLAIMTGQLPRLAYWLLDNFPALGSIG